MQVSALLLACSVYADDALLSSVAYVHGRGSPYAVLSIHPLEFDERADAGPSQSVAAALLEVQRILAAGGTPALGLLPVLPDWGAEFGRAIEELFDPCIDIQVASAKLSEFDYTCKVRGTNGELQRRGCVLDLYGRELGLPAFRRAVLADLSLPPPFPAADTDQPNVLPSALVSATSSGLFFVVKPPPPSVSVESPSLLPKARR